MDIREGDDYIICYLLNYIYSKENYKFISLHLIEQQALMLIIK